MNLSKKVSKLQNVPRAFVHCPQAHFWFMWCHYVYTASIASKVPQIVDNTIILTHLIGYEWI